MAYLISQIRKNSNGTYMTDVPVTPITIQSPNPFGDSYTFEDFALQGNFVSGKVYYLRFTIHRIPKYFYSGSKSQQQVVNYEQSADTLNLQIILKNSEDIDQKKNPPEIIGTCTVNMSLETQHDQYSSYAFVFSPTREFDILGFRIMRTSFDAIYAGEGRQGQYRKWLLPKPPEDPEGQGDIDIVNQRRWTSEGQVYITTSGPRIYFGQQVTGEENANLKGDVCQLSNLIPNEHNFWLKIGYQCRPGALIVINKQPIRVGRSGIYELDNGTDIKSFMIANPNGSQTKYIDAFLLDYAYKGSS